MFTYVQDEYSIQNYAKPALMAFYDDNDFIGDKLSFELRSPTRQTLQADFTFGSFDNNLMNAKRFDGLATSVYIANPNSLPTGNDQYTISVD